MANFRPRKRKPLADALTEEQISFLVDGPNPFIEASRADEVVTEAFGSVEHFRVIFDAYRDDLFKLAAPNHPWGWWALEGPGMEESPHDLRIMSAPSQLKQVPPEMARSFLELGLK
jgi:hypothetical protein